MRHSASWVQDLAHDARTTTASEHVCGTTTCCRYQCMAEIELMRHRAGRAPQKYFGKWPFIRVYGIQVR